MIRPTIDIFTEVTKNTGFGHLTRCIALAEILANSSTDVMLAVQCDSTDIASMNDEVKIHKIDWQNQQILRQHLAHRQPSVVIIDSYIALLEIYDIFAEYPVRLICIDDFRRIPYPSKALIINPGLGGRYVDYGSATVKTGLEYILLRAPFREAMRKRSHAPVVRSILLTLGGGSGTEIANAMEEILRLLAQDYTSLRKQIVVGPQFPTSSLAARILDSNIHIYQNLTARQMREIILNSDIAITAGGQTTYEVARCGVPMIVLTTAENQKFNVQALLDEGLISATCDLTDSYVQFVSIELEKLKSPDKRMIRTSYHFQNFVCGKAYRDLVESILP